MIVKNSFIRATLLASVLLGVASATMPLRATEMIVSMEPAVILMKKYIDEHLEKFECTKDESMDERVLITSYSYDGVTISQHITRRAVDNLIYKLNGVELEVDIGRHLFYYIQQMLEGVVQDKTHKVAELNKYDSCSVIEDVLRTKRSDTSATRDEIK